MSSLFNAGSLTLTLESSFVQERRNYIVRYSLFVINFGLIDLIFVLNIDCLLFDQLSN